MNPSFRSILRFALCLIPLSSALADDLTWNGGDGDNVINWNIDSNWSGGAQPTTEDSVSIDNGTVGLSRSTQAVMNNLYLGTIASANGGVIVSGVSASLTSQNGIYVGYNGTGSVRVSHGAEVTSGSVLTIANGNSAQGSVAVSGINTSLESASMEVGYLGKGSLTISDRAKVSVLGSLTIGEGVDSEGIINIGAAQGDAATSAGELTVADSGYITFGSGTGTLLFNHTNTNYEVVSTIKGGTSSKSNIYLINGATRFTGDLTAYAGNMSVQGGTLSIAVGETLTLGGDYQQVTGTLMLGANSLASFGKLKVTNMATFAKDAKIYVDVSQVNTLAVGTMTKVIEAGILSSDGFVVTDNSALFNFRANVEGSNVHLTVLNNVEALETVENQNLTSGRGAAKVLDTFLSGRATGGDMDEVVTSLGQLSSNQAVSEAIAQTLPLMSGSSAKASTSVMQANSNVVSARQSGMASGDDFITDKHAWVKPVGSWAKQDARNGVSGFDASTFGIIGGLDGDLNDTSSIGFALSYMRTSLDGNGTNSTNSADIDAYQAIAYGQQQFGEDFHNLDLSWQAAIGFNQTDGTRRITFMDSKAKSNYNSYTSNLSVGLGRTFAMDRDTSLTPSVRAAYSYIKDYSYQESGAGALNLNVASNTTDALVISVNGDLSHRIDDQVALLASAGVGYDLLNDASSSTASFAGGGAAFTTEGLELSPVVITAGVGVNYALNDATDITVRYDLEGRSDFLSQTATAKVTWVF